MLGLGILLAPFPNVIIICRMLECDCEADKQNESAHTREIVTAETEH